MGKNSSGFTLVEIMIVIMIIGLLASLSYPSYKNSRDKAQRTVCINNLRVLQYAADQYLLNDPESTEIPPGALDEYYSREDTPECPSGGTYSLIITNGNAQAYCDFGFGHEL